MRPERNTQKDQSAVLEPEIVPSAHWRIKHVEALDGFRLRVEFVDGLTGFVEMANLLHSPRAGVFAVLADPLKFAQVSLEYGVVTWPGEIDLAPDAMYEAIQQTGKWTL